MARPHLRRPTAALFAAAALSLGAAACGDDGEVPRSGEEERSQLEQPGHGERGSQQEPGEPRPGADSGGGEVPGSSGDIGTGSGTPEP